jgi:hypothetical protein
MRGVVLYYDYVIYLVITLHPETAEVAPTFEKGSVNQLESCFIIIQSTL